MQGLDSRTTVISQQDVHIFLSQTEGYLHMNTIFFK